jgi:hypothetical protein
MQRRVLEGAVLRWNYPKHKCVPWPWKHQSPRPCDQIAMIPDDHQNHYLTCTTHATIKLLHLQKCQHHCHALVVPMCCAYFQRSLASQVALKGQQLVCVSEDQPSEPDMRHACWKQMKSSRLGVGVVMEKPGIPGAHHRLQALSVGCGVLDRRTCQHMVCGYRQLLQIINRSPRYVRTERFAGGKSRRNCGFGFGDMRLVLGAL